MKARYILFAVAALTLAACSKTNEQPEPDGIQMIFRAYQEGSPGTKTTVQNGGTQVYWEPADEIKVFFKGSGSRFVSQNTNEATVADFSGTLNILIGANEGASSTTKIFGLYPYRADAVSDGSSVTTTLPAEQTGRAGSFAKNTHISLAATNANSVDLGFYNVTGGLRFSLTQEGIKSVTFQGNNGENLAGKIKLAFEGGIPAIKEVSEGETVITLNAPGGGTFQTGQWYYIEAIPGTLSKGFKMVFSKGNESAKLSSSSSVTIGRGKYGSLADADEGLIFKENGGDEPDPSSVIQFADPIAKYACVEKFDTNGDGEVSYAEAATATSLEGLFTNWNTVTRFDEIQYFTGVTSTVGVFDNLSKLESITIPDFITTLGSFSLCTSLKTVVLPNTLVSIPRGCFSYCSSLINVSLPSGIPSIPAGCFEGCSSLATVTLPSGIKSIMENAFYRCTALASIEFPAGLETISYDAFQSCESLSSLIFPNSLLSISSYAFAACTNLTSVTIPSGTIDRGAFQQCYALSYVVLPSDMNEISDCLFSDCGNLTSITWPDNVTSIGNSAFAGCTFAANNYTIELPASTTQIGQRAFYQGPRHIIIPSTSAVSIEEKAFGELYAYLYVPAGMIEMYKVRSNWSYYAEMIRPLSDYPVEPKVGGSVGEAVDLGLSVKWATWNVGASAPEDYGGYFSWGSTAPKWDYYWSTYKWCNGSEKTQTKYNTNSYYGTVDNKTVLDPEDDAAHMNWGGSWRMPTLEECEELINKCTWTWTSQNGVNGRLVTGPNGKSIFLPAAGDRDATYLSKAGSRGYYWSSSLYTGGPSDAQIIGFGSDYVGRGSSGRYLGLSVRPVCPVPLSGQEVTIAIDFTKELSVLPQGSSNGVQDGTYTFDNYTFTFHAADKFYQAKSGENYYLLFGKANSYIQFPAIEGKSLLKVEFLTGAGASESVIADLAKADGTRLNVNNDKLKKGTKYEWAVSGEPGAAYRITVTNAYNMQFQTLTLTYDTYE